MPQSLRGCGEEACTATHCKGSAREGLKVLGLPHELAVGLPPNGMPLLPALQKEEEHHQTPLMKQAWGWSSIASGAAV